MKKTVSILFVLILSFTLPSCAERRLVSCREILEELKDAEVGLPAKKHTT